MYCGICVVNSGRMSGTWPPWTSVKIFSTYWPAGSWIRSMFMSGCAWLNAALMSRKYFPVLGSLNIQLG